MGKIALACVAVLMLTPALRAQPRASDDGHFVQNGDETLLLIGDSGTQCVLQNLNIDYHQWIDDCRQAGIRVVHIWAMMAPRQKADGSVIEARYGYVYPGATPWARRSDGPPGTDGLAQWDLTRLDEGSDPNAHYWPRLRDLCRYAKKRKIIVGVTVFFGWPKHNTNERPDWSYHPFNVANGGHLVETERMTSVCQQIHSPDVEVVDETWSEEWPPAKKTQWVWERYSRKLIEDTERFGNTFFVFMDEHSYTEGNCGDHFLEFFKRRGATWMDWEQRREGVDWVMTGTFERADKNAESVECFDRRPTRPIFHIEGPPYEGDGARTALWTFAIGGGHTIFHGDERQGLVTRGIMGYDPHVQGGDKNATMREWVGHASRFFNQHLGDLTGMAPHNELVVAGEAYCFADPGRTYAFYSLAGDSFRADLSAASGKLRARLYDPRTGEFGKAFRVEAEASVTIEKLDERDWAVLVAVR